MTFPEAERAARYLALSWAVAWIGVPISGGFGSVIVQDLSNGNLALTGIPYALVYLGSLLVAYPAGRLMDRHGRIPVLIGGHVTIAAGFGLGTLAILMGSLWGFLAAHLLASMGTATTYLTRLAAADLYPAGERGRGLGRLVFFLIFGALLGIPVTRLAEALQPQLGGNLLVILWSIVPVLALIAAFLLTRIKVDPKEIAIRIHAEDVAAAKPKIQLSGSPRRALLAAGGTLLFAQAAMATPMSVSGASLSHAGHGADLISLTLALHVVGMFGFSPLIGRIGDRWGRRPLLILAGVYLLPSSLLVHWKPEGSILLVALVLIGIGWSFAFIGSTAMVTDVAALTHRGRSVGAIDSGTALIGGSGSLAAGWMLQSGGLAQVALLGSAFAAAALLIALMAPRVLRAQPPPPERLPAGSQTT